MRLSLTISLTVCCIATAICQTTPRTATATVGGALDNVGAADVGAVLDNVRPAEVVGVLDLLATDKVDNILDFVAVAYDGHSYDSSGFWGDNSMTPYPSAPYKGPMPVYVPEDFYRPVWGRITSSFGYRPKFGRVHKGVDLALNTGDTVRAALPGIVGRVGYDAGGYGNFVVVVHSNGVETRYAHLQAPLTTVGNKVEAGQPIALGGNTGNSTGPHLHFEVRYLGTAVDPLSVFDFSGKTNNTFKRKPEAAPSKRVATGANAGKSTLKGKHTYIVRQGDTVKKIAERAGLTTLRLCQLNFITADTPLEPGRMLKLQ